MNIAVVGNPITSLSSGKFLGKFLRLLEPAANIVFVVNDGFPGITDSKFCFVDSVRHFVEVRRRKPHFLSAVWFYLMAQIGLSMGLMKCIKKVDVVFVFPIVMFLPVMLAKIFGKRVILYEAQDILSERLVPGVIPKIRYIGLLCARSVTLFLTDQILVEGESVIKTNHIGEYRNRIRICPQFVDTSVYHIKKPIGERGNLISFVGSMEERKGAMEFALSVRYLAGTRGDIRFKIVGIGPLAGEVRSLLLDLIDSNVVEMLESIPEDAFSDFLNETKVLVVPSISEGLPNLVLEAMACGTIVIATPVGAIPDVVKDGMTGFIIDRNLPDCISNGIAKALDYHDLNGMCANSLLLICREYSYEAAVRRYLDLLDA